ncbi:YybH family protein [Cellulosimicrobium protaetiae]|uniref:Nuclear transport factor 2 family protein n=1 Tax=Cellulosimicrobium protaetiae TaxID=2587808 RepID=A0A6M5UK81_9MICO|nr:nuclear transport factor 2 family protein [Cellulosimicrobium protaetiae]QJW37735.1 nuclear transport factor 2 family protein [Cellulosimicrobium protaetiae]
MSPHEARERVVAWVGAYEGAWRASDTTAVERLFTPDATYLRSPYDDAPLHGHDAIRGFWRADEGATFTVTAEPVAVEWPDAVVRLEVRYLAPDEQDYRDLWVLRFAPDGRVAHFEEWPYWPGRSYTAADGS